MLSYGTFHHIYVAESPGKGRGLFAGDGIPCGATIERAPVQVLPANVSEFIITSCCYDLFLDWFDPEEIQKRVAFGLGLFSLCNHSTNPNAALIKLYDLAYIELTATKTIQGGDEILILYSTPSPNLI